MSTPNPIEEERDGPAEVVVKVLRWIGVLAVNPALGGGGIRREKLAVLAARLATLIEGGSETWDELRSFAAEIRRMVETNSEPSEIQWQAMRDRDAAVRSTLAQRAQELRAKIAAEAPQPEPPQQ